MRTNGGTTQKSWMFPKFCRIVPHQYLILPWSLATPRVKCVPDSSVLWEDVSERERERGGIKVSILYMYMCPSRQSDLIILNGLTLNHRALQHTRTHTITRAHRKGERNPLEWPSSGNTGIRRMQRGRQRGWTRTHWGWKRKSRKKEEKTPAEAERNKKREPVSDMLHFSPSPCSHWGFCFFSN